MTDEETALLNDVARAGTFAADRVMLEGQHRTAAEATAAAVREAFTCAFANGLIRLVPREEWPEYQALDPPYELPEWIKS